MRHIMDVRPLADDPSSVRATLKQSASQITPYSDTVRLDPSPPSR